MGHLLMQQVNAEPTNTTAGNVVVQYDNEPFQLSDVSIKYDDIWGPTMIGLILNNGSNNIEGVNFSVESYDANNHLIGVSSGYPQLSDFQQFDMSAFKISLDRDIKESQLHHIYIQILARDWGNLQRPQSTNENVSALVRNLSDYTTNTTNNGSLVITHNDMEPHLKPNDTVVYSNSASFNNLSVGDIIVFRAPDAKTEDGKPKVIIHRVAEIGNFFQKEVIRTKGDANPYSMPGIDYPIFKENYMGKVVSVTHNNNTTTITESK